MSLLLPGSLEAEEWLILARRKSHAVAANLRELYDGLFLNLYTGQVKYKENQYKGPDFDRVQAHWDRTRKWSLQDATALFPSRLALLPHFQKLDYLDVAAWG